MCSKDTRCARLYNSLLARNCCLDLRKAMVVKFNFLTFSSNWDRGWKNIAAFNFIPIVVMLNDVRFGFHGGVKLKILSRDSS